MTFIFINHAPQDKADAEKLAAFLCEQGLNVWNPARPAPPLSAVGLLLTLLTPAARKADNIARSLEEAATLNKPSLALLHKGHAWKSMAETPQADVRQGKKPDAAFLGRLAAALGAGQKGELLSELSSPAPLEDNAQTIMHRPQAFGQLRDALRAVLKDGSRTGKGS